MAGVDGAVHHVHMVAHYPLPRRRKGMGTPWPLHTPDIPSTSPSQTLPKRGCFGMCTFTEKIPLLGPFYTPSEGYI